MYFSNHGGQNGRVVFFRISSYNGYLALITETRGFGWQSDRQEKKSSNHHCVVICRTICSKLASSTTSRVSKQCILILVESISDADEDLGNSLKSTEIKGVFCFNTFSRICIGVIKDD